jgi:hypothetical protein
MSGSAFTYWNQFVLVEEAVVVGLPIPVQAGLAELGIGCGLAGSHDEVDIVFAAVLTLTKALANRIGLLHDR